MNIEEFAFILMGMIIMIILYILLGKLMEHKHVLPPPSSGTTCMRPASASSSDCSSGSWLRCSASCTRSTSTKRSSFMGCCRP